MALLARTPNLAYLLLHLSVIENIFYGCRNKPIMGKFPLIATEPPLTHALDRGTIIIPILNLLLLIYS